MENFSIQFWLADAFSFCLWYNSFKQQNLHILRVFVPFLSEMCNNKLYQTKGEKFMKLSVLDELLQENFYSRLENLSPAAKKYAGRASELEKEIKDCLDDEKKKKL